MTTPAPRGKRQQIVLEVLRTEQLTPHLVRVWAGGPGREQFTPNAFTDAYVKLHFAAPELGLTPPYDLDELRETLPPEQLPVTRTYTVRAVTDAAIALDFVVHGDGDGTEGIAGPWAASARPGDPLVLSGPGGAYAPDPTADSHLLLGDESALPAIAAALEGMPDDARGLVLVEVTDGADELELARPTGIELRWLHRDGPAGSVPVLADAVAALEKPAGRVQVFAHGERECMKAVRDVVVKRWEVPRSDLSLSGYWALGRTEDRFQAEKREPVGVIL